MYHYIPTLAGVFGYCMNYKLIEHIYDPIPFLTFVTFSKECSPSLFFFEVLGNSLRSYHIYTYFTFLYDPHQGRLLSFRMHPPPHLLLSGHDGVGDRLPSGRNVPCTPCISHIFHVFSYLHSSNGVILNVTDQFISDDSR